MYLTVSCSQEVHTGTVDFISNKQNSELVVDQEIQIDRRWPVTCFLQTSLYEKQITGQEQIPELTAKQVSRYPANSTRIKSTKKI